MATASVSPFVFPLELELVRQPSAPAEFAPAFMGPVGRVEGGISIIGTLPEMADLPETGSAGDAYIIDNYLIVWTEAG